MCASTMLDLDIIIDLCTKVIHAEKRLLRQLRNEIFFPDIVRRAYMRECKLVKA